MRLPITRERIRTHFHYAWWQYVLLVCLAVFGWNLLYTTTRYRSPEALKVEWYCQGVVDAQSQEKLDALMETDFYRIRETFTLGDLVHVIAHARRNIFPVIDNFGRLLGVVQLDDLREDMFKREKWGTSISRYMIQPPDRILQHEQIQSVLPKFEENQTWMLPVVDKQNRYLGFISKSRILNAYREQLVKIQQ